MMFLFPYGGGGGSGGSCGLCGSGGSGGRSNPGSPNAVNQNNSVDKPWDLYVQKYNQNWDITDDKRSECYDTNGVMTAWGHGRTESHYNDL
jgi:hypothetical protein